MYLLEVFLIVVSVLDDALRVHVGAERRQRRDEHERGDAEGHPEQQQRVLPVLLHHQSLSL